MTYHDELRRMQARYADHQRTHAYIAVEGRFNRITEIAAAHYDRPIAFVSLVHDGSLALGACIGFDLDGIAAGDSFCDQALRAGPHAVFSVADATADARFAGHPLVTGPANIRSYTGAVLTTANGANVGVLAIVDTKPRPVPSDDELRVLRTLARLVVDQIELGQARRALDEQRRLMGIAEAMAGVGHWRFDVASQRITWSDEVFRIHGVEPAAEAPDYATIQALYHEDDRDTLTSAIDRAIETGQGYEFTLRIRRPDGKVRHTLAKAECARDASGKVVSIFGLFQDITDQHLAALALTESEHRYRLLASNVSDVISVYGTDGRFRYMSPSVEDLLGYQPEEFIGRSPYEFIVEDDHKRVAAAFAAHAQCADRMTIEYRVRSKDGRIRWLEAKPRFHRNAAGELIEISDSVRDVTERQEREAALRQARIDAEAAARAKTTFLANMSHEIRTPMNGVIGFTELLLSERLEPSQREKVQMIADSGAAMMRLLNDILDLSKIEVGQITIARAPLDLRQLIENCATLMRPLAGHRGLTILTTIADDVPNFILGDDLRLRQVVLNLIGNAVKFTERGLVAIDAQVARDGSGDWLCIGVRDTGIGIAADRQQAIFNEFVQADESTARRYGGTGLGLAISAQLVRLMDGTIGLASEPSRGTVVTLRLPLSVAPHAERPVDSLPARSPISTHRRTPLRILVAEDHAVNQQLIAAMLARLSIMPDIVGDGEAAAARAIEAHASTRPYDLVLMDIQMPIRDGFDATRAIRAHGIDALTLPIVALTANAYAVDIGQCLAAGMQDHLPKPITLASVQTMITRWTGTARLDDGTSSTRGTPLSRVAA